MHPTSPLGHEMERKLTAEIIMSDFDSDNDALTQCLDSCQNSNIWPYSQNVLFKSFPMEEEILEDQERSVVTSELNSDTTGCDHQRQEQVTHIEIIKSSRVPRRVTGASRVVPSLTNAWHQTNLQASEPSITEVYTKFMHCEAETRENKCETCHLEFVSAIQVAHHTRLEHPEVTITADFCFVCRKRYSFPSHLKDHLSTCHGIERPETMCKSCFTEFNSASELKAHERKHGNDFRCPSCALSFTSAHARHRHGDAHAAESKPFQCRACGKRFFNETSHLLHGSRHAKLSCMTCDLLFGDERSYLEHIKSHAPDAVKHLLSRTATLDREEDQLDDMLDSYRKHGRHGDDVDSCMDSMLVAVTTAGSIKSIEVESDFECRLCRAPAATARSLAEHHAARHGRSRTCPFCRSLSASFSQLRKHMNTHLTATRIANPAAFKRKPHSRPDSTPRPFPCPACRRRFVSGAARDKHVAGHGQAVTAVGCGACARTFVRPKYLARHVRDAHETTHGCHSCDKTFETRAALRRHATNHSAANARPAFKCSKCDVACSTRSGLRVHARTHTDERPYACAACDRCFKRPQALKKHHLLLHADRAAIARTCPDCPSKFHDNGNLLRHFLRIHRGLCRFVCGVCGDRFGQNHDLRRHLKVKHDTEIPALRGGTKKSVKEIYVLPATDVSAETAAKIRAAVDEENAKFDGFAERFDMISRRDEADPTESTELAELSLPDPPAFVRAEDVRQLFQCELCHALFCVLTHFRDHVAKRRENKCRLCDEAFCEFTSLQSHLETRHSTIPDLQSHLETVPEILPNLQSHLDISHETLPNLQSHLDISHETLPNPQSHLDISHETLPNLQSHLDISHETLPNLQSHLEISHETLPNLQSHLETAPEILPNLQSHLETVQETLPHLQSHQDISHETLPNLQSHLETTHEALQMLDICYRCGICQVDFTAKDSLTEHLQAVHGVTVQFDISPEDLCASVAIEPPGKMAAMQGQQEAGDIPVTVNEITRFSRDDGLAVETPYFGVTAPMFELQAPQEVQREVAPDPAVDDAPKKMTCAQCGKNFPEVGRLIRHINTHLGIKPHACLSCPKRFAEKHNLAVHQRSHTQERPFGCEDCGARLRYRKELADHASRHRGVKPHACAECPRTFLRSGELARHVRTHSLVKKYSCSTCGKCFRRVDELRAHGRVHAVEADRPFPCSVCAKKFPTRHKLGQHATLHADSKMFVCHLCGKSFALEFYLNSHLKTHARRETYVNCPKCSRMFSTKETLEVHLRKFHAKIAKKGRGNLRGGKEDVSTESSRQGRDCGEVEPELEVTEPEVTETEVTETEVPQELLSLEGKDQMIYFHSDGSEIEPTFIYINSVL